MKVGVLKFGTVNWELDVIKVHGLDTREGFTLEVQPFGGNDAADVALMGGAVDAIVEDWLFVSRQRADGLTPDLHPLLEQCRCGDGQARQRHRQRSPTSRARGSALPAGRSTRAG